MSPQKKAGPPVHPKRFDRFTCETKVARSQRVSKGGEICASRISGYLNEGDPDAANVCVCVFFEPTAVDLLPSLFFAAHVQVMTPKGFNL